MSDGSACAHSLGVVVIGRNEGDRLRGCLHSVPGECAPTVVYVDSGSTDASVRTARLLGAHVVELDLVTPFTAARARNVGWRRLLELSPDLAFVQFVDGDCELAPNWLAVAIDYLVSSPGVAAVCGRRRERFPDRSVYNLLCDFEWDAPAGEAKACGGDVMMRAEALRGAGGYRDDLIAGEEPELCVRLRRAGWRVRRLDVEMTLHDAAMTRFVQWWRRAVRSGYAFAQGAWLHGAPPERHWVRESLSAWLWGLAIPFAICGAIGATGPAAAVLVSVYPLQMLRLGLRGRRSTRENMLRGAFLVLGKFPEVIGQIRFLRAILTGGRRELIEYK